MQGIDTDILLTVGGFLVFIILLVVILLTGQGGGGRKEMQQKLDRMRSRFNARVASKDGVRAVKIDRGPTGIAGILAGFIPKPDQIKIRLMQSGMDMDLGRYATICGGILLGMSLLLSLIGVPPGLAILVGILAGLGLPHMFVGFKISRRLNKFTKQFPDAIDLMVRGLKSGLPVNECIANVGQEMLDPMGVEFRRIVDEMRLGKTLENALWDAAKRLDTPDFKFFVISLSVQKETGGNLGETLENLGKILRQRQAMKLKVKAMSSEAKASAMIIGALPFIMLGVILSMNYDYGIVLFTHPKAIMAGIGALIWMTIGAFIMKKMISFEI